ncbi:MAG TPA: glycosyltransferase [Gaiellaceae bacterium]|nr:glycosyltransferase [Gaiellaceae bacterium]
MRTVCWARYGSAPPMGQQVYETELGKALRGHWSIEERTVLPLRAERTTGARRVPLRLVWSAPFAVARAVGSSLYGGSDLVHRLDLRCPPARQPEVVTIHDLPPLRFDDEGSLPGWAARSAREAAAVICPSEFAAAEVRELLGVETIHVVPYGIDAERPAPLSGAELEQLGLRPPFILHPAGATKRKNLDGLAGAWREVSAARPDAMLVLCGPPHPRRDELFAGLPGVRYLGLREPAFVAALMGAAATVVVPSLYEGFGLPALEAMAAGTPAVAAARGALPELCRDGALLVEPTADALAAGILETLAGGDAVEARRTRGRAIAHEYTWERAAEETARAYAAVLA